MIVQEYMWLAELCVTDYRKAFDLLNELAVAVRGSCALEAASLLRRKND